MAPRDKKPAPAPEKKPISMGSKNKPYQRSTAKGLKNEWRRMQKTGDIRSLRSYVRETGTDLGSAWLYNKSLG